MPASPGVVLIDLVVAVLIVGSGVLVMVTLLKAFNRVVPFDRSTALTLLASVLTATAALASYAAHVRWVEARAVTELSLAGAFVELAAGLAIGAGLCVLVIGTVWAIGCYRVATVNPPSVITPVLATVVITGVVEEIALRGIAFRLAEDAFGIGFAFLLTAALFGVLHARNPHATLTTTLAIASSGGLVLGAAFVLTRRLWLPIGIHVAWNLMQSGVFGVPVSGRRVRGWLQGELRGPALISGGPFGIEGSIVVVVFGLALTIALLAFARGGHYAYAF